MTDTFDWKSHAEEIAFPRNVSPSANERMSWQVESLGFVYVNFEKGSTGHLVAGTIPDLNNEHLKNFPFDEPATSKYQALKDAIGYLVRIQNSTSG